MDKPELSTEEHQKKKRRVAKADDPLPKMLPMTLQIVSMLTDEKNTFYSAAVVSEKRKEDLHDTNFLYEAFNHAHNEETKEKMINTVFQLKTVVGQLSLMCKKIKDKKSVSTSKPDFSSENAINRQSLKNLEDKLKQLAAYKNAMITNTNTTSTTTVKKDVEDELCDEYDQNTDEVVGMIQSVEQE